MRFKGLKLLKEAKEPFGFNERARLEATFDANR